MEHLLCVTSSVLIEWFLYLQAMFVVYLQYLLVTHRLSFRFWFTHTFILVLFIGLKFRIIPYELGGLLDQFLWGTYNILFFIFVIFLVRRLWEQRREIDELKSKMENGKATNISVNPR